MVPKYSPLATTCFLSFVSTATTCDSGAANNSCIPIFTLSSGKLFHFRMSSAFRLCSFAMENNPSFFTTVYNLLAGISFTESMAFFVSGFTFFTTGAAATASFGSTFAGLLISLRTEVVTFSFLMIFKLSPAIILEPLILFHFLRSATVTSNLDAISAKLSPDFTLWYFTTSFCTVTFSTVYCGFVFTSTGTAATSWLIEGLESVSFTARLDSEILILRFLPDFKYDEFNPFHFLISSSVTSYLAAISAMLSPFLTLWYLMSPELIFTTTGA